MPPKSKRYKNNEALKENICVSIKSKSKNVCKTPKATRKALGDKTNSASDDNEQLTSPKLQSKEITCVPSKIDIVDEVRARRSRRRPDRFLGNQGLTECYGNQVKNQNCDSADSSINKKSENKKQKNAVIVLTPLKTSNVTKEQSLADSRPKRICRLPSKFEDHSISPSKFVPVKPIQASTPIILNKGTKITSKVSNVKSKNSVKRTLQRVQSKTDNQENLKANKSKVNSNKSKNVSKENLNTSKVQSIKPFLRKKDMLSTQKSDKEDVASGKHADTNNNAKEIVQDKRLYNKHSDFVAVDKNHIKGKRFLEKDYSFKVFDGVKQATKRNSSNVDVYEFTFDPNDEPPPQKKKRKRVTRKKLEKAIPTFTNNYDKNVAKSLAALKKALSSKSSQSKPQQSKATVKQTTDQNHEPYNIILNTNEPKRKREEKKGDQEINPQNNFNSFHVEDIVLNHESTNDHNDINYSPVNSPNHVRLPSEPKQDNIEGLTTNKDPLNLQNDISFFDECPAASSSMNVSTRNPSATPWRVEFGQLPIKWQINTYVKPNMTPAVESSFINFGDENKKHVYTNMVPEENEALPEIVESDNTPKLKQTSIMSFIKEMVDKTERKKSKTKSTPVKGNSVFDDISNNSIYSTVTPVKENATDDVNKITPKKKKSSDKVTGTTNNMTLRDKENTIKTLENVENNNKKNNDITFFGFDEIEVEDQENISPRKNKDKRRIRDLRPRSRIVLQELNAQAGPARVQIAVINKTKAVENAEGMFDKLKSTTDAQVLSENTVDNNSETTNDANNAVKADSANLSQEDSQSVHLFEDLDIVHHMKPSRKSYGKAKKVAFRQNSASSDTQDSDFAQEQIGSSEEEDNLEDLTFQMPSMQPKKSQRKKKAKNKLSKKEEKRQTHGRLDSIPCVRILMDLI